MDFYTNVVQWGNFLLVRGVDKNQRVNFRLKYKPTLFVPVMKQTDWKTLDGKSVTPYQFDCIKDAKDFLLKYESQPHLVHGLNRFAYTYISDTFPQKVNWNIDKILIMTIDIEVQCENGFPNPESAIEPLLSITVKNQQSKKIGGTLVDLTTANLMTQVWNKVNDSSKEKMNKMNAKQLTNLILRIWKGVGTPRV